MKLHELQLFLAGALLTVILVELAQNKFGDAAFTFAVMVLNLLGWLDGREAKK